MVNFTDLCYISNLGGHSRNHHNKLLWFIFLPVLVILASSAFNLSHSGIPVCTCTYNYELKPTDDSWRRTIQTCDFSSELHIFNLTVMWSNL
ncbi:hypothetical protein E2C01_068191 [Portunus trituberculatus]|uniref:Uncharacterized protein n=1 Tax=Portunus trituberculatus TaxID=210409 RepID=A0A5B7HLT2_PORTR|nr:hypothetical protein [Portunus trituberculatus]